MANVRGISKPEFRRSFQEDIANSQNDRAFLSLADIHDFKQAAIAFTEIKYVSEHVVNEIFQDIWRKEGRIGCAQRLDESRFDKVEVGEILLFSGNKLMYDATRKQVSKLNLKCLLRLTFAY